MKSLDAEPFEKFRIWPKRSKGSLVSNLLQLGYDFEIFRTPGRTLHFD